MEEIEAEEGARSGDDSLDLFGFSFVRIVKPEAVLWIGVVGREVGREVVVALEADEEDMGGGAEVGMKVRALDR